MPKLTAQPAIEAAKLSVSVAPDLPATRGRAGTCPGGHAHHHVLRNRMGWGGCGVEINRQHLGHMIERFREIERRAAQARRGDPLLIGAETSLENAAAVVTKHLPDPPLSQHISDRVNPYPRDGYPFRDSEQRVGSSNFCVFTTPLAAFGEH